MIKLQDFILKESMSPVRIKSESDLETVDNLIKYCYEMGEDSQIMWRGMRVPQRHSIYHVVQDRDWFRGANTGAQTIMKKLEVKNPAFAYIGNMQSITRLFGRTFVVVLKEPYRVFQSEVVSDVMAWAQPTIYKETETGGGLHRAQIGIRTKEQQIQKALEGAKTYNQLKDFKNLSKERHELIIDTQDYWAVDIGEIFANAGKFARNYQKEKERVSFSRIGKFEDHLEYYSEVIDLLTSYRKFTAWKFKNPR